MAASSSLHLTIIVFLIYLPAPAFSQLPSITSPPTSTADCGSRLLPLAPCLPYVQGSTDQPTQLCCNSLQQVYTQAPACLCLLLAGTAPISLPVNTSLALQLPALCSLQMDPSSCPGASAPPVPQTSPVSLGPNTTSPASNTTNSTAAASPAPTISPRPSALQFGLLSAGYKLLYAGHFTAVVGAATNLLLANYKFIKL